MNKYPYTTTDLAAELGVTPKTIRQWAAPLGLGINLDGRVGYRYSDADRQRLIDSRKPTVVKKRRKRGRGRAA